MSDKKPKPIPRKTPVDKSKTSGGKKKGGPSMREQIAARKKVELEAPSKAAAPKPTKGPAPARSGGASRSSARGAGGRKGRGSRDDKGDDDNGGTTRGRRARPEKKKKSPVPMIAAGVIILGGAGAYFGGVFDGDKAEAAETEEGTATAGLDAGADARAAAGGGADMEAASEGDATDATEEVTPADAAEAEASAAEAKAAAKAAAKATEAELSKAKVDMSGLTTFGQPPGATEEQWAKLQEQATEFFDPFSGAAGGRAQKKLIAAGKIAWPAILNEMIKLNPDDPDDNRMGWRAADALDRARGSDTGRALDWRTAQNSATGEMKAKDLYFNKRLIILHHEAWAKVLEDPEHWSKFDKTDAATEAAARAKAKAEEAAKEGGDEFDDLDLDEIDID